MDALVLFSHGSLLCGSGEAVDRHADRLSSLGIADRVAVGYLNYTEPLFADTVDRLVAEGVDRIVVLPYFLAPGYFVTHALPGALDPVRRKHPGVAFTVADVLGDDPVWRDIVVEAAANARGAESWGEPLVRAGRACRDRSDCPLHGTPDCPASRNRASE
ncbi:MAG: sirohydrochlorin chelatase [Armatimonadota bacterium]